MKKAFVISGFLILLFQATAQNIVVSEISTYNQFPIGDIFCTFQDSEGYMWYGTTRGGLYRDDGYSVKTFRSDSNTPDLLENNSVTCITEDHEKQIWFGTKRGAYILDKKTYQVRALADERLKSRVINTANTTYDGTVWISSGNMLYRYNFQEKVIGTYKSEWQGHSKNIYSFYEDYNHTVWVIQWRGGLLRFDTVEDCFIPYPWRFLETPTCILQDSITSYYWIGTWGKGIVRFDPKEKSEEKMFVPQPVTSTGKDILKKRINCIAQDSVKNFIWITTMDDLYAFDVTEGNMLQPVETSDFLPPEKKIMHGIRSDRSGNLWVASYYPHSFILSFQSGEIDYYSMPQVKKELEFPVSPLRIMYEDGYYWFRQLRSYLCLYEIATDKFSTYKGQGLLAFFEKSRSMNGILCVKNDATIVLIKNENGQIKESAVCTLPVKENERIRTLHEDQSGNIWIGTNYSLIKYNTVTEEFHIVWENTGIINYIASSNDGNIFVATESNGFLRVSPNGEKEQYNFNNDDNCLSLSVTPEQNVWIRTQQNRIYFYNIHENSFIEKTLEYDLSNNIIYDVVADNQGNLWILTDQKIIIYDLKKQDFHLIRSSDPAIHLNDFTTIYKDDEDRMHIGGTGGILVVSRGGSIPQNSDNSLIKLTDLRINGEASHCENEKIILQPNERNIELFFSTFDHVNSGKIRFAFRYKGQNSYWNYMPEGQNNIYLTELSKGNYELEIKATNKNGSWNENTISILIQRLPAWYETWWAYTLYILFILTIVFAIIWQYIEYQKKQQHALMKEQMSQMKYRFFTNISHELRTPLTLIITPLETIIKKVSDITIKQQLESVNRNAQNLLSLVNQLLDFRKMEMGGEKLSLVKGDINLFLNSIYENFRLIAEEKELQLSYYSEFSSLYLFYDHDKIRKITNNLLSNAIKFTEAGGSIELFLYEERIESRDYIVIEAKDTGKGISEKELSHIFERFHQANPQEKSMGSGIGLHLVKEYAMIHQGNVFVRSEVGKGAVFSVRIPADLKPNDQQTDGISYTDNCVLPVQQPNNSQKKVLIVEDNNEFRTYMKNELNLHYAIYEARNGKEGEKRALEISPDIIITDLMMPEMDGIELCHKIKNNIEVSHIPVILLTANDNIENEKRGYKEGADAYISKPFHWDILLSRIQNLINQKLLRQQTFEEEIEVNPGTITISLVDEQLLRKALTLIEKNMSNSEYSIEEFSRDMAMSRVSLYRKIHSITGKTPTDFVKSIRLKRAAELLKQGQLNVAEVSYSVGFSTPGYFTQSFKKEFGVLPTQYR